MGEGIVRKVIQESGWEIIPLTVMAVTWSPRQCKLDPLFLLHCYNSTWVCWITPNLPSATQNQNPYQQKHISLSILSLGQPDWWFSVLKGKRKKKKKPNKKKKNLTPIFKKAFATESCSLTKIVIIKIIMYSSFSTFPWALQLAVLARSFKL